MNPNHPLTLGIDIGTSSVKVCVIDQLTDQILRSYVHETNANEKPTTTTCNGDPDSDILVTNEQDVNKICRSLEICMSQLEDANLTSNVNVIGVAGQMHGVVLWVDENCVTWSKKSSSCSVKNVSNLITWQDGRCTSDFLSSLPTPRSNLPVASGYGCASLFWLNKYQPDFIEKYNRAGTIQDFIVSNLCKIYPTMSEQNGASWGYFDTNDNEWNIEILENANFPVHLLPKIKKSGEIAGELNDTWFGIKKGTKIGVAMGDLQCSVLATREIEHDAVLNLSTSAQLALITLKDFRPSNLTSSTPSPPSSIQYFPYFEDRFLAVAASLNGGNVLKSFVDTIRYWFNDLGVTPLDETILWEKLLSLSTHIPSSSSIKIDPFLFGERHNPDIRASISHIDTSNTSLGAVFRALCSGIVRNIRLMVPDEILLRDEKMRLVATGSALTRNPILREELALHFPTFEIVFRDQSDAAVGAALAMSDVKKKLKLKSKIV